jgi:hypothetical protein
LASYAFGTGKGAVEEGQPFHLAITDLKVCPDRVDSQVRKADFQGLFTDCAHSFSQPVGIVLIDLCAGSVNALQVVFFEDFGNSVHGFGMVWAGGSNFLQPPFEGFGP